MKFVLLCIKLYSRTMQEMANTLLNGKRERLGMGL